MKKIIVIIAGYTLFLFNTTALAQKKFDYPFQNPALTVDERLLDVISRMTLQEKFSQLFEQAVAIDRLGIPAYTWWNEALHGVARAGRATVFPQAIGMAATFDENLMLRIGTAISDEGRAKHNFFLQNNVRSIYTGLTFWSPNINIFRDPRWGRGQETYGEDPLLTGQLAVQFIKGLQGNDPKYFKTIATAKHYAVHSGPEFSRHVDNIFVNDRDLYDTYLPAFKAAIQQGNVQSVMCAYNRFRDKPCCGSDLLLSNILRNRFGFSGYVVSDCGAISDFYTKNAHHVVETPSQAIGWSLASGTDLNCEESKAFLQDKFDSAVNAGVINEKDINISLSRLFRARFMLGLFDPEEQVPFAKISMSVVGDEKHLQLSLEAAEKSLVLLKNNGILPLKNVKKIALIGPNADNESMQLGNYNGQPIKPVTVLKALQNKLGKTNVIYTPGCAMVPGVFTNLSVINYANLFHMENGKLKNGLKAEYFSNDSLAGKADITRIDSSISFYWLKSPIHQLVEETFSARWSGVLIPTESGKYLFGGNLQLTINKQPVPVEGIALEKGKQYQLEAKLVVAPFWWANTIEPTATLSWVNTTIDYSTQALRAAAQSDVIIFCGGISPNLEGEEMPLETDGFSHGDRTHINLPGIQEELLKELQKTGKPIVYINFSGSAIALNWEAANLPAIVQAFYPGEASGTAITRLLFGQINPSGRLPVTFYKSVKDLPDFKDYKMEGRTYRYFKGMPLYEFGFGLSYTTFKYNNLKLPESIPTGSDVKLVVEVTNTGKMAGEEVVQVYTSHPGELKYAPIRTLVSFKRVFLKAGETKQVEITIKAAQLAITDDSFDQVVKAGKLIISAGGKQPDKAGVESGSNVEAVVTLAGKDFQTDK